ncbi:MAG: iron ABC transporter permease [Rhizobiaceae bacterium]|jgi:iron(III) transport system permease protein|nr:iron ABC transporter permease [Rhizobiaceae bacterium]
MLQRTSDMPARPIARGSTEWPAPLLVAACVLIAGAVALPMVMAALAALTGTWATAASLMQTLIPRAALTTFVLVLLVGTGVAIVGTISAWLVTQCRFPGVRVLEIALALPLAFPAYVMAYAYGVFLDYPGPVQTALRAVTGWGPQDYVFPSIRSTGGAALLLTIVLYPYVYLLARAAFLRQSRHAFLCARTLGASPWRAFTTVSVPMARPAIAAGVALALMETVADFGTVAHLGVQTFATAIYQAWFSMGDRPAAAQLALCLLIVALVLLGLERSQRGQAKHHDAARRLRPAEPFELKGTVAVAAFAACALPVLLGFILPVGILLSMAAGSDQSLTAPRFLGYAANSVWLAGLAAAVTVCAAVILSLARRFLRSRPVDTSHRMAGLGYAVPGGVIAVGLLVPFAAFDNWLDGVSRDLFGISTGLLFTGSVTLLVFAYMVRFLAPALGALESGYDTIRPNLDRAARLLGSGPGEVVRRIHLPLMTTSLMTAALIVFVDVMKELPATLIMRPFNYDTLAVHAYRLAADERLADAGLPSLVIVAFGLLPVILLCRTIASGGNADLPLADE